MKRSLLFSMLLVGVLSGVAVLGLSFSDRPSPLAAVATRILLPLIQDQTDASGTPAPTGTPTSTPTSTPTATPLPTSTPYPTVDINANPIREGPRPDERPDLRVEAVALTPAFPVAGESVAVEVRIANGGTADVPNALVAFWADGVLLVERRADLLAVDTTRLHFTWPAVAGLHTLTAVVDPHQELVERNLSDNSLTVDVPVAPAGQAAELAVTALTLVPGPDGSQVLHVEVRNGGSTSVQAPLILTAGGVTVATLLVEPMAPGAVASFDQPVTLPPEQALLGAEINPRFRTQEPNPNDNVRNVDLRPEVDLLVDSLTVEGALVEEGRPRQVTVSFRLVNAGQTAVNTAFRTRVFPGDLAAGGDDVALNLAAFILTTTGLGPGQVDYVARTVTLPVGVDQFEARIEADLDNAVAETNEANNVATALYRNPTSNVGRWVNLGPRRMTDSGKLGYPWNDATGRLASIAIDPTNPNVIYVGARLSGVWKTADGGASWQPIADSLPTLSVAALALDPANPARVLLVTANNGVFRSPDGGNSWSQLSTTDLQAHVHGGKLIISPANSNLLLTTTGGGVRRSVDGGATWQLVLAGGSATGLVLDPTNANRLYAALYHETSDAVAGVYISEDAGATWRKLQGCPGAALPTATAKVFLTLAMSGGKLFNGQRSAAQFQLYRTTGQTCTVQVNGQPRTEPRWETGWQTTTDHGVLWSGLYADPSNANFLYMGGTDFWRSTDGGTTFARSSGYGTPSGSAHADHHGWAADPLTPATIYTLNDGGIYRSTNRGQPGSWVFIGDGLRIGEFYDHALAATGEPPGPDLIIGGTQDNGTLKYDGSSAVWKMILGGDGATVDIDPTNADHLLAMHQYVDSIKRSTNGGGNMQGIAGGLPTGAICFNLHFQIHPGTPTTLLASCSHACSGGVCAGGLWRTTNPGSNWSVLFTPPAGGVNRSAVDAAVNLYYAGTSDGRLFAGPGGANWRQVFVSPVGAAGVVDLDVDLDDPATVYLVLARTDTGRIFRLRRTSAAPTSMTGVDITADLPTGLRVNTLAVDRMQPFTLFAGTPKGVYRGRSGDHGATWHWIAYTNGMPAATDIRDLEVHPTTGVLRAATHGRSVYQVYTDDPLGSLLAAEGKLTFLRVHDVGSGWGPAGDFLDVEVVVKLDSAPGKAFGFQLRLDNNEGAHQGMLDLLRDAFNEDYRVRVEYVRTGIHNGRILRVLVLP